MHTHRNVVTPTYSTVRKTAAQHRGTRTFPPAAAPEPSTPYSSAAPGSVHAPYDAFTRPDGTLITAIGDVTGHGLKAAVMMGQLRNALRAYAMSEDTPGALLTRLHAFLRHTEPDLCATAVITQHRPNDPNVTWASAGHLPPLLRDPQGQVRTLHQRGGAMLGLPLDQTVRDHHLILEPGSTLLLYTDGLVERCTEGIDPGIERLAQTLHTLGPGIDDDPQAAAEAILRHMLPNCSRQDDICLLITHVPAPETEPAGREVNTPPHQAATLWP